MSDNESRLWVEGISDGGAPMYAEANGWYWYSDYDGQGTRTYGDWAELTPHERAAHYLRVDPSELPRDMDREAFAAFVETLRPRWAAEGPAIHAANVAREQAEDRAERNRDTALTRGITITSEERDPTPEEQTDSARDPGATFWTVKLAYRGRSMTTPFRMGSAHEGDPEAADVLSSLILDADGIANAPTFEDWCAEYGYDNNSRKAERTYKAVKSLSEKVRRLLGDDYDTRAELARSR